MRFWNSLSPVVKAVLEHSIRGGITALAAAYFGGTLVLDQININKLSEVVGIFVSGFVVSLLVSLGISAKTGTGPALNKAESFDPNAPVQQPRNQRGQLDISLALLIGIFIGVVLLLFHVHFGG